MCFDLQWSGAAASVVGCQALEGVMEGFCGCATTVSTWVLELDTLRQRHGYLYGLASVSVALAFLVVIMGSLDWTKGFKAPVCWIVLTTLLSKYINHIRFLFGCYRLWKRLLIHSYLPYTFLCSAKRHYGKFIRQESET
jgi:CrcB-like protein, Camphor Resistance (CrcB)